MFNDYHITMDSFGEYLPQNWQEIADYLNEIIDSRITPDEITGEITWEDREIINQLWEDYCNGDRGGTAPDPIW